MNLTPLAELRKIKNLFFILVFIAVSVECSSKPNVVVDKKLVASLDRYSNVYVKVKNPNYRYGSVMVDSDIYDYIEHIGLNPIYNEKKADLIIVCYVLHGFGVPRIIRHFNIKTTYVTKVNLKLIDSASGTIIGEVRYKRPFTKTNQQAHPEGYIKKMLDELIKSRNISPSAMED